MHSKQHKGTILIMDDEPMVREIAKQMFEYLGYGAVSASDGENAVELYLKSSQQGETIQAVILDVNVPGGMGGKEAVVKLLEIDNKALVIVSSGNPNDPIMTRYKEYGFSACLAKPFEISSVDDLLNDLLDQK